MEWQPDFAGASPMFDAVAAHAAALRAHDAWPSRETLQRLLDKRRIATASGAPLRLVAPGGDIAYEERIYRDAEMEFREGESHDLFNVLAWLAYPKTKAALNRAHHLALGKSPADRASRGPVRDALTLFDESGAIVASSEPALLEDIRAFRWKRLFWDERDRARRSLRVLVLGHGVLAKALHPYLGMTAHVLLFEVEADEIAAPPETLSARLDARVARRMDEVGSPHDLAPLPLLGVPGWWAENENAAFYDSADYFRTGRSRNGRPSVSRPPRRTNARRRP